jgi:hypothetical protein
LFLCSSTGGTETGLGDLNVFAAYLFDTGNPAISFVFDRKLSVFKQMELT